MSNLHDSYTRILSLLHELDSTNNFLNQKRKPKMNDKELIALNLAAESLGIDSERYLFSLMPSVLKRKIERSVYNRRRRKLNFKLEQFRSHIAKRIDPEASHHVIDSMPLEVCKISRANRVKICHDSEENSPDHGYCAAQKTYYFGYKLHAVCTVAGVFKTFDISKASIHDIHYLEDVRQQFNNCVLIGDKGYLNKHVQRELFEENAIKLETPKRQNQIDYKPFNPSLRKARKRMETLYSQLCDQFMIRRNYAKSFAGFASRVLAKITALTVIQWINLRNGNNINNIKIAVS